MASLELVQEQKTQQEGLVETTDKALESITAKLRGCGYVETFSKSLIDMQIAEAEKLMKSGKANCEPRNCINPNIKPACISATSREISLKGGISNDAKRIGTTLGLNAELFSWMYVESIATHEFTHFLDLLDPTNCYLSSFVFQYVLWNATVMTAKNGMSALFEQYPLPNGDRVDLSRLICLNNVSRFWTEAHATYKQREFLRSHLHTKEAREFFKYFELDQVSNKPCSQLRVCDYQNLALHLIKQAEKGFGSFENVDARIRSGFGNRCFYDANLIPLLTLSSIDPITCQNMSKLCNTANTVLSNLCSEQSCSTIREWQKLLLIDADECLVPVLQGRIHEALMSMVVVRVNKPDNEYQQTCSRLFANSEKWKALSKEDQELCVDLFRLRLNIFRGIQYEILHNCVRDEICPILDLLSNGNSSALRGMVCSMRAFTPTAALSGKIDELRSSIVDRLGRHYRNNRDSFKEPPRLVWGANRNEHNSATEVRP